MLAVVTGSNRGLGWHVAHQLAEKGYHVIAAARQHHQALEVARSIRQQGGDASPFALDVANGEQIIELASWITELFGGVEVLVNNAGIFVDQGQSLTDIELEAWNNTLAVNLTGAMLMCKYMLPLMRSGGYGRIVNVSSGYGSLQESGGLQAAYRVSKAGMNGLTRVLAAEVEGDNIKVNSVCPGWVRTDMGGSEASRDPAESAQWITWAATLDDDGPNGEFLRDGKPIPL
ncbi:SDR family NAD(P)-dependent oxidoreductase [Ferrimonas aestuarii]|uniref:SDR family NAD(P)-dependent oxidoreductase n=1 Tax=Ferrimonas aestuarii TaxID=2569539 RepID=A0A4U1BN68_9GAMM|nr:SDR family NAD(P)-dependent oxidoreductase [Ferrimonas aestuarii]TKB55363.1 SDR family NAD(P)-dependent oxidoreductase [Ferrimonas aestuarii]